MQIEDGREDKMTISRQFSWRWIAPVIGLALACPQAARAGGVVSTCSEAGLKAALFGGGKVTFSCNGTIKVLGGTINISANTTIDGSGHSVTISGGGKVQVFVVDSGATFHLNRITVADGNANNGNGGGMLNNETGTVTVTNSTFRGNAAQYVVGPAGFGGNGGGIYNHGMLTVTDSTFEDNTASAGSQTSGEGGGIYNDGDLFITNSSFHGNSAMSGGGIFNGSPSQTGVLVVNGSVFYGNLVSGSYSSGGGGGGIFNQGIIMAVSNSTFHANGGSGAGGGNIYNCCNSKGTALLSNATLAAGIAATGEGGNVSNLTNFQQAGTLFLENTILGGAAGANNCYGSVTDGGGNLRWPTSDSSCVGSYGNPKLGVLQNNGGPTDTMALLPGSAAIDTAFDALCTPTDQRGVIRPQGPHCDIGAFEANTAKSLGRALLGQLNAFLPSLLSQAAVDRLTDRVITPLENSLDPNLWPEGDGNHVNPLDGSEVFTLQRAVVNSLSQLIVDPIQLAYIDNLVLADRTLAVVALDDKGCGMNPNPGPSAVVSSACAQAAAQLADGDTSAGDGDYGEAIVHYMNVWQLTKP